MSLRNRQPHALIKQGWIRALLLFIVYLVVSVFAGLIFEHYAVQEETFNNASGTSSYVLLAVASLLSFGVVFAFRKYVERRTFVSLGLSVSSFSPGGWIGFLLGVLLVCAGGLMIHLMGGLQWTHVQFTSDFFLSLVILLLVAFSEELVFRGYILRNLMKSFNKWLSLTISASLFALVHLMNPGIPVIGIINIILGGLVLGITVINTRNLWMPVLFHFSWNFSQGPVLGFPVSGLSFRSVLSTALDGSSLINGGGFGFEGSLICTVLLLVTFLVFLLSKRAV